MLHATLFRRSDEVEAAWRVTDPLLAFWEAGKGGPLATYEAGTWGPKEADAFLAKNGHFWRTPPYGQPLGTYQEAALRLHGFRVMRMRVTEEYDDRLSARVLAELAQVDDMDMTRIRVHANRGDVTLRGEVDSLRARAQARAVAGQVEGVLDLVDELRVDELPDIAWEYGPKETEFRTRAATEATMSTRYWPPMP